MSVTRTPAMPSEGTVTAFDAGWNAHEAVYDEMLGGLAGGFTVTEWVALDGNWYVAESTTHPLDWRIAVSVSTEETRWKKWTRPRVDFAPVEGLGARKPRRMTVALAGPFTSESVIPSRPTSLLLAPHHDDETLFAAFTIMRDRPVVAIVLESHLQEARGNAVPGPFAPKPITNAMRVSETHDALYELGGHDIETGAEFWPFRDDAPDWNAVDDHLRDRLRSPEPVTRLYAPAYHHEGHDHHNALAVIAEEAALDGALELVRYATYTRGTPDVRVATQVPASFETDWVARKLRALACYRSQIHLWPHHFIGDQREWYV